MTTSRRSLRLFERSMRCVWCITNGFFLCFVVYALRLRITVTARTATSPQRPASPRRPSGVYAPQRSAYRMSSTPPPREMDPYPYRAAHGQFLFTIYATKAGARIFFSGIFSSATVFWDRAPSLYFTTARITCRLVGPVQAGTRSPPRKPVSRMVCWIDSVRNL